MSAVTKEVIKAKVADLMARATDGTCPVRLPPCSIVATTTFDLRGRAAGMCRTRKISPGQYEVTIRLNPEAIKIDDGNFVLREVIPHEVAHAFAAVAYFETADYRTARAFKGHGAGWRLFARWLGATGSATCSVELKPVRNLRKYVYRLPSGQEFHLTAQRHRKLQNSAGFIVYRDGSRVASHHFVGKVA